MRCGTANAEITIHSADIPEPLNFKDCFKPGVGQNIDRIPVHASPILRYAAFLTFVFFPQTASVVAVLFLFPVCVCVCACVCVVIFVLFVVVLVFSPVHFWLLMCHDQ